MCSDCGWQFTSKQTHLALSRRPRLIAHSCYTGASASCCASPFVVRPLHPAASCRCSAAARSSRQGFAHSPPAPPAMDWTKMLRGEQPKSTQKPPLASGAMRSARGGWQTVQDDAEPADQTQNPPTSSRKQRPGSTSALRSTPQVPGNAAGVGQRGQVFGRQLQPCFRFPASN